MNATIAHEVLYSSISEKDKAAILSINSIIHHIISEAAPKHQPGQSKDGVYQQTATVVYVIILAVQVAISGYVVGIAVGAASCCIFQGNCTWDCMSPYGIDGALVALGDEYLLPLLAV